MENLQMNLNSRIYFLDTNFTLFEIFKYNLLNQSFVLQKIGDTESKDFIKKSNYIWKRRSNLSSLSLEIIYSEYHPLTLKGNNSYDVRGLYSEIFYALQDKLHFQYTMHHQEDNMWGSPQENGSYSGMLGQIQSGKVNWTIADTTITLERSEFFDFSIPIMLQHRKLVSLKPRENFNYLSYLCVFSKEFWIALFIFAVILILFMFLILFKSPVCHEYKSNCLATSFTFIVFSLFGREIFPLDTSWSGKILCFAIMVWGFLISVSYNAILTSVLASAPTITSFDSLEDLLKSKDHTLIMKTDGSIRDYFARAPETSIGMKLVVRSLFIFIAAC